MTLSNKQKAFLKGEAHHLKPVVMVGHKGLTETLSKEIAANLLAHELIKIKFNESIADNRQSMCEEIGNACDAQIIALLGHVLILYKTNEEKPKFKLPK